MSRWLSHHFSRPIYLFIPSPPGPQDLFRPGATTSLFVFFSAFLIPASLPCIGLFPRPSIQNKQKAAASRNLSFLCLFVTLSPYACSSLHSPLITQHPAVYILILLELFLTGIFGPQLTTNNHFPGCLLTFFYRVNCSSVLSSFASFPPATLFLALYFPQLPSVIPQRVLYT